MSVTRARQTNRTEPNQTDAPSDEFPCCNWMAPPVGANKLPMASTRLDLLALLVPTDQPTYRTICVRRRKFLASLCTRSAFNRSSRFAHSFYSFRTSPNETDRSTSSTAAVIRLFIPSAFTFAGCYVALHDHAAPPSGRRVTQLRPTKSVLCLPRKFIDYILPVCKFIDKLIFAIYFIITGNIHTHTSHVDVKWLEINFKK